MKNIIFAVSEMEGIVKTGGLADVAKALPLALNQFGYDTRVILPYYQQVQNILPLSNAITSYEFSLDLSVFYPVKVHCFRHNGVTIYCVDIDALFNRFGIYSSGYDAYADNGERFAVFSISVLHFFQHFAEQIAFKPHVIHCNDWHTALIPALFQQSEYWRNQYCETLLSIHNGAFQGVFSRISTPSLESRLTEDCFDYDTVNFLKLGIRYAGKIVAVSPNYAKELLTPLGSHYLYDTFQEAKDKCHGILNGCDYKDWSPDTDPLIDIPYDVDHLEKKAKNKHALQKQLGLTIDPTVPVVAQVSRITDQKGLDYLIPALFELVQHRVQIVIAGQGDPFYVEQLKRISNKYPSKIHFHDGYSETMAHRYMAGADYFLVPSLFEPCGLTQMYALAYGALPIVREVGGLKDTVRDLTQPNANGFVFSEPNAAHLVSAIRRGLVFYHECQKTYKEMQRRAMNTKFNWKDSAEKYVGLYHSLLNEKKLDESLLSNVSLYETLQMNHHSNNDENLDILAS